VVAHLLAAIGHRQRIAILKTILNQPCSAADLVSTLNLGTTGAAAAAGLAGPVVDAGRAMGMGFAGLFMLSAVAFVASAALALRLTPSHGAMGAAFDAPA